MTEPEAPEILPATIDRWADVQAVLDGSGEKGCWCQAWRGRDEVARAAGESRPETLRRQLKDGSPPPGYLAYLDGVPVGWVGIGVRTETPRLVNSRTIPAVDDLPVWSIGCFRIRTGYRRRGIATALLGGVIDAARRRARRASRHTRSTRQDAASTPASHSWASPRCSTRRASAG